LLIDEALGDEIGGGFDDLDNEDDSKLFESKKPSVEPENNN